MRNLPTDLLRALLAVIDAGGFTRAGERLGRTQSAVSLQIKRLEAMVGAPLFEREAGGGPPRPTEAGREAALFARRILALNDEMVERLSREARAPRLRLGLPNDYADAHLASLITGIGRKGGDGVRLEIDCDLSVQLLRRLRDGDLDLVVAQSAGLPEERDAAAAARRWRDPLVWVGAAETACREDGPVRLLAYPEGCNYRREMLAALARAGRSFEIVCVSHSLASIEAMLRAGFGVTALSARAVPDRLRRLGPEAGLPALDPLTVGIHARGGLAEGPAARLALRLADLLAQRLGGGGGAAGTQTLPLP